jgi:DNA topoisomerase-1
MLLEPASAPGGTIVIKAVPGEKGKRAASPRKGVAPSRARSVKPAAPAQAAEVAPAELHCKAAGLLYVDDGCIGVTRKRAGKRFQYFDTDGKRIRDETEIARINALAIPPAYTEVWICPQATGHIQATGRDARGRKQYRYHASWQEVRGADKYGQLTEFAHALPRIRRRVTTDLARTGLSQPKVAAVVVRLLETTLIRIGTPAYARANGSYGLTTLRPRHTTVAGQHIRFRFKGKSGVEHDVTVRDRRIASVVKRCMEIRGHELFSYQDEDGTKRAIDSGCVNDYLREAGHADFTAKHYRTWAGSVLALAELRKRPSATPAEAKRTVVDVVKDVARRLGNTPSVCRQCYIHPKVIDTYLEGALPALERAPAGPRGLNADERRLLQFLSAA